MLIIHPKQFFLRPDKFPSDPQLYELLQLSRKERECRTKFLQAVRKLHDWKNNMAKAKDRPYYLQQKVEEITIQRQINDALIRYKTVRKYRVRLFKNYIEKLPKRGEYFKKAS